MLLYDQDQVQDPPYRLVRCSDCTLEFIADPVPKEQIFKHYPTDNSAYAGELGEAIPPIKRFLYWLDARLLLKKLKPGDAVLDVGAGLGTFAHYLKTKGIDIAAADFGPPAQWPRKNIPYFQFDLNGAIPAQKIVQHFGRAPKAIIMRHVLEHVYEPAKVVRALAALHPEYFLIMVPNGRSLFRHLFGRHWGFFDPPRHLVNFNRKALARIFQDAGYGEISSTSYGMDEVAISLYRGGHGWNQKLRAWFSWTSKAMLISSALSLCFGRSVLVVLAKRTSN